MNWIWGRNLGYIVAEQLRNGEIPRCSTTDISFRRRFNYGSRFPSPTKLKMNKFSLFFIFRRYKSCSGWCTENSGIFWKIELLQNTLVLPLMRSESIIIPRLWMRRVLILFKILTNCLIIAKVHSIYICSCIYPPHLQNINSQRWILCQNKGVVSDFLPSFLFPISKMKKIIITIIGSLILHFFGT